MSGVDVLAVMDRAVVDELPLMSAVDMKEARATVAELIEKNEQLTKAVRAFADGDMSEAMRMRLFYASSDEPAKSTFADLCTANDECEAALSRVRGAE